MSLEINRQKKDVREDGAERNQDFNIKIEAPALAEIGKVILGVLGAVALSAMQGSQQK